MWPYIQLAAMKGNTSTQAPRNFRFFNHGDRNALSSKQIGTVESPEPGPDNGYILYFRIHSLYTVMSMLPVRLTPEK